MAKLAKKVVIPTLLFIVPILLKKKKQTKTVKE